jgi:hypothetical protein
LLMEDRWWFFARCVLWTGRAQIILLVFRADISVQVIGQHQRHCDLCDYCKIVPNVTVRGSYLLEFSTVNFVCRSRKSAYAFFSVLRAIW